MAQLSGGQRLTGYWIFRDMGGGPWVAGGMALIIVAWQGRRGHECGEMVVW